MSEVEEIWDPTEPQKDVTPGQVAYLRGLVERLNSEADWSGLTEFSAKQSIQWLNNVRKSLGLPFKPMDGVDSGRGPQ